MSAEPAVPGDARVLLDGLAEPAALVALEGAILHHNAPFRALTGGSVVGRRLAELDCDGRAGLQEFLRRASGTGAPLLGTIRLASRSGARHRLHACRVRLEHRPALLVQLDAREEQRFARLSRELAELNREVAERRHAQAVLAETLRERELLLRELQHRVKNNMHMLASLVRRAERDSVHPEARAALSDVLAKVTAIGAVQQLLYGPTHPTTIDVLELVEAVARSVVMLAPHGIDCAISGTSLRAEISAATSLALILNELLTNAIKHGAPDCEEPQIEVTTRCEYERFVLVVTDNGPGFDTGGPGESSSGLGLVRGLLRQLGGSLAVERDKGSRCTVAVPLQIMTGEEG